MSNRTRNSEYYEKRFGDIAIEKGFISHDELIKALTIQGREEIDSGTYLLIREIFLDQNTMHVNQIEEVVKAVFN